MLEQLFGSKTRVKLLRLLYRKPEKVWFVRELTRALDTQINAVRREIDLLLDSGLIKEVDKKDKSDEKSKVKKKYYALDSSCLLYDDLRSLLMKAQVSDQDQFIQTLVQKAGKVQLFLLTGRFTGDTSVQSDMLLVGRNMKQRTIDKVISAYEKSIGFDIRYTVMQPEEYLDRKDMMDKFIYSLLEAKHILVRNELKP